MRFYRTLRYAAILLILCPVYAESQQEIRPPIGGTVLFKNALNSAERGYVAAQFNLGMMYYRGTHIPRNLKEAAKWFGKAAKQKHAGAQYQLGVMYLQGEGVSQDYDEAAKWFGKASDQNHYDAQLQLGLMYLQGQGFPENSEKAVKLFEKAAEQNVPAAQFNLGLMYLQGERIPRDYDKAAKWLRKAAEQGDTSAQCMLGAMYIEGWGVTRDYAEAYKWLTLSLTGSRDPQILGKAKNWRDLIAGKISRQQLREAEQTAEQWKPSLKYVPFGVKLVSPTPEIMANLRSSMARIMAESNNRSTAIDSEKAATGPEKREVQNEPEKNSETVASPNQYASWAVDSVRKSLNSRGEAAEGFRLELTREPVVRPDCSTLHRKGSNESQRSAASRKFPDAFVLVDIYQGDELEEQAIVVFMNRNPTVRFSDQKSRRPAFSEDPMDGMELLQVIRQLDPFFTTALDITQRSERFNAFLPEDIRSLFKHPDRKFRMHMPPGAVDPSWREMLSKETSYAGKGSLDGVDGWKKKLSDKELRRFVALSLDLIFQRVWLAFEGLEGDPGGNLKPRLLVSNPPEYIKQLEKSVSKNRRLLKDEGVMTSEHLKITADYMKQLLDPSAITKEVAQPKPCPCFLLPYSSEGYIYNKESELEARNKIPVNAKLYLFKMANLNFHFGIVDENPRIVCIALD